MGVQNRVRRTYGDVRRIFDRPRITGQPRSEFDRTVPRTRFSTGYGAVEIAPDRFRSGADGPTGYRAKSGAIRSIIRDPSGPFGSIPNIRAISDRATFRASDRTRFGSGASNSGRFGSVGRFGRFPFIGVSSAETISTRGGRSAPGRMDRLSGDVRPANRFPGFVGPTDRPGSDFDPDRSAVRAVRSDDPDRNEPVRDGNRFRAAPRGPGIGVRPTGEIRVRGYRGPTVRERVPHPGRVRGPGDTARSGRIDRDARPARVFAEDRPEPSGFRRFGRGVYRSISRHSDFPIPVGIPSDRGMDRTDRNGRPVTRSFGGSAVRGFHPPNYTEPGGIRPPEFTRTARFRPSPRAGNSTGPDTRIRSIIPVPSFVRATLRYRYGTPGDPTRPSPFRVVAARKSAFPADRSELRESHLAPHPPGRTTLRQRFQI